MKNFICFLKNAAPAALAILAAFSCERVDVNPQDDSMPMSSAISLPEVAKMLSSLPLEADHLSEVHDAVSSSSSNGYDEEYTMGHLMSSPGSGVGDDLVSKAPSRYRKPLRDLIAEYYRRNPPTRASSDILEAGAILDSLSASDVQIYWPWSENWDGKTSPVVTFDPENNSTKNVGYERLVDSKGTVTVREIYVDEDVARRRPIWVVNRNSDAGFKSLEMLLKENPSLEEGGVITLGGRMPANKSAGNRSLMIDSMKALRNYDPWFAGASEFFFKVGSVEKFTASTEEEMLRYSPSITDFMVVMRRSQIGENIPFKVVLVSDWTSQLESCAMMINEDDGGTRTVWNCSATVKVQSKSYGFDISIPFNTRDDIVWRGQLARNYLEAYNGSPARFGDIELTFRIVDK